MYLSIYFLIKTIINWEQSSILKERNFQNRLRPDCVFYTDVQPGLVSCPFVQEGGSKSRHSYQYFI